MATATDQQVQQFVNERLRVRAEQLRAILAGMKDDKAAIDDVYAALVQQNPTWTDQRTDGPPYLLTGSDVLAYNAFINAVIPAIENNENWPVVLQGCVRPVGG